MKSLFRSIRRTLVLARARNTEFIRDRGSMSWNFLFPFLVVGGFAFAYSGPPKPLYTVAVYNVANHEGSRSLASAALAWQYVQYIPVTELTPAVGKVERHQYDLLLAPDEHRYWVNASSPKGYVLEKMLAGLPGETWQKQAADGREVRYVDWLLPGIVGLNLTFSALFGVGYVIVRYRKNGVLKRFKATPLSALEFLSAQVLSRFFIISTTTAIVLIGSVWILRIPMHGSWLDLAVVYMLGAFCMISIGVLAACRVRSEELAGGILNFVTWPMMFFSGIWFSLEGLNPLLQKLALIFPLTHLLQAARAIMIDGAGLSSQLSHLTVMLGVGAFALIVGASLFRWE